jgi:hypothetical protein
LEGKATRGEKEMIAKGHMIVRAIIIPDEFNAWCRECIHDLFKLCRCALAFTALCESIAARKVG